VPAPSGEIAESWSEDYRVAYLDAGGDTTRVIERDLSRLEITEPEWDAEEARFDSLIAGLPGAACDPRRPVRPGAKGLLRALFFDDLGRLWVERRTNRGLALDAFDGQGEFLGSVEIPDRAESVPVFIRGNRVYLVVEDDLEVERVVAFEIRRGGE
jgi:hypothetical protein